MFEDEPAGSLGDPGALLHLASDTPAVERGAGCHKLEVAAAWADCHGAPAALELSHAEPVGQSVLIDRFVRMGPVGTPLVAECCPAELALPMQISVVAARRLIGTALTIRHRLPRLWDRVKAGQVWAWKARHIAEQTAALGLLSARIVDRMVTPQIEAMAWGRFQGVLDATILHVDEAGYQQRAERAAARRDVRVHADGDEDSVGVRRSKAFGIIAHQGRLRDLLARHADQPDDEAQPDSDRDGSTEAQMDDQNPPAANGWSACPGRLPAAFGGPEGSTFDLRPLTRRDLDACNLKVVVNVHLTDHTLIDQPGVVRTPDGPVTLDQFRRWLTDTDPNITIRPVLDPAATAPVDGYEIPLHLRRALRSPPSRIGVR